jgi:F-type H+-transporting ATPase subunit b
MRSFHKFSQRTCLVLLRLCKHPHVVYLAASLLFSRTMASSSSPSNPPLPAERGAEITDKLPSHASLITKTGSAILGSGLLATAISQKLCVFNEETVIAVGYFILFAYIAKVRTLHWGVNFSIFFSLGSLSVV